MSIFNISKIKGNNNEVQQDVKTEGSFSWKLWQIIVGIATIIGAIVAIVEFVI